MPSFPLLVCGMSTWQFIGLVAGVCFFSAIYLIVSLRHGIKQYLIGAAGGLGIALFCLCFWYPLCAISQPFAADKSYESGMVIFVWLPLALIVACTLGIGMSVGSEENFNWGECG